MKKIMTQCFALLLAMTLCATVQAQQRLQKVKIASGGHVVHFLPVDLAVALGFFEDESLDPEVVFLKGGTATAQALISKQVDFSTNGIDHALKAAVQGRDNLRMVVLLNQTPGVVLVVDSKYKDAVKTIGDLKGMRLGVTSLGSASHMVLAFLLSKSGVNLDEVSVVKAGTSTFPAALKNGNIDGGIAIPFFVSSMVEQGEAFILQRLITAEDSQDAFGGQYSLTGILTRQDVIDTQPELVQKVVNVQVRALKWIREHSEEEITRMLPIEVVGSDKERYVNMLKALKIFLSPDGMLSEEGAANVLASMKLSGILEASTPLQAQQFLVDRFLKSGSTPSPPLTKMMKGPDTKPVSDDDANWFFYLLFGVLAIGILIVLFFREKK